MLRLVSVGGGTHCIYCEKSQAIPLWRDKLGKGEGQLLPALKLPSSVAVLLRRVDRQTGIAES